MPDAPFHALLTDPEANQILDALALAGGEGRFVGGVVRDLLTGKGIGDVDIATTLPPHLTIKAIEHAGIRAVPTGLDHGTITAVMNARPFEITTLRRDVATDGRHAQVAFSTDWRQDAARRDFTFNALYLDREGRLYDYFDGVQDLAAKRVRFIGDPAQRMREDYLRILRYFRFSALIGVSDLDPALHEAFLTCRSGLRGLSMERVRTELLKLLGAEDPMPSLSLMRQLDLFEEILPQLRNLVRVAALIERERLHDLPRDPIRRLTAFSDGPDAIRRLKLSKSETGRALSLLKAAKNDTVTELKAHLPELLHRRGPQEIQDRILLADSASPTPSDQLPQLLERIAAWQPKHLPVAGRDLIERGMVPGKAMGEKLRDLEQRWIDSGFTLSKDELLASLQISGSQ